MVSSNLRELNILRNIADVSFYSVLLILAHQFPLLMCTQANKVAFSAVSLTRKKTKIPIINQQITSGHQNACQETLIAMSNKVSERVSEEAN